MNDLGIGIVGCAGRMGRALVRQVIASEGCILVGGAEHERHPAIGEDLGEKSGLGQLGLFVEQDAAALFETADAVLEFSVPDATTKHARMASETKTIHIIGTTALDADHHKIISEASQSTVIVAAANMSLGVNLLRVLTQQVSSILADDFDIEVLETHHRYKLDSPSGTALALGKAAARGRGVDHDQRSIRTREGITEERRRGDIGYAVMRGGNVVGEHTVVFAADDERLEISHKAGDRRIFARGAVTAALWGRDKLPGLYDMEDVLGLRDGTTSD